MRFTFTILGSIALEEVSYIPSQRSHTLWRTVKERNRKIRNVVSNAHTNRWYVKSFIRDYEFSPARQAKTARILDFRTKILEGRDYSLRINSN